MTCYCKCTQFVASFPPLVQNSPHVALARKFYPTWFALVGQRTLTVSLGSNLSVRWGHKTPLVCSTKGKVSHKVVKTLPGLVVPIGVCGWLATHWAAELSVASDHRTECLRGTRVLPLEPQAVTIYSFYLPHNLLLHRLLAQIPSHFSILNLYNLYSVY